MDPLLYKWVCSQMLGLRELSAVISGTPAIFNLERIIGLSKTRSQTNWRPEQQVKDAAENKHR